MTALGAPPADPVLAQLDANAAAFEALFGIAQQHLHSGEHEAAAAAISEAASAAWARHPGFHASARLERLVTGLRLPAPAERLALPPAPDRQRVLHVLTAAYATGGHTRLVERLIRADSGRAHSCIVLAPQGDVPARLRDAVVASGGSLTLLDRGGHLARAAALRALAREADLAVAYPHPDDVITPAAFADSVGRPPLAMLNHADHTYWLGASVPDLLVNVRASGAELAARRRAIAPDRSAILPAPLDAPAREPTRDEARRLLGIGADDIVLVCAGSHWKFDPAGVTGLPSFTDLVAPLVARDPRVRCFVFGPIDIDGWVDASRLTGGRMRAMGNRLDLGLYQRAADIALDSLPLGSTYSLLEAAALGVPALSMHPWPAEAATLQIDSPGLGDARLIARDAEDYVDMLANLLDSPLRRQELGARLAAQVAARHIGDGWRHALAGVLAAVEPARAAHAADPGLPDDVDVRTDNALDRALVAVPVRPAVLPERAIVHVPLARSSPVWRTASAPSPSGASTASTPSISTQQETTHA